MTDESKRWLNTWNSALLLGAMLLASLFSGFCCIYTFAYYKDGLLLMVLIILLITIFIEMILL
jgi:hypothetical protein